MSPSPRIRRSKRRGVVVGAGLEVFGNHDRNIMKTGVFCVNHWGIFGKMGGFSSFLPNIRLDHRNLEQNI
jgi:hypothetical protein